MEEDKSETSIGQYILQQMEACGYKSQRELAKRSGISPGAVSYIIHGEYLGSEETVKKVAKALNVDPEELERFRKRKLVHKQIVEDTAFPNSLTSGKGSETDLEQLIGSGELSDTAKAPLTQYVVDSYTSLFQAGLQKAMEQCKTRVDALHFLARLERIYQHVIAPALEGRMEDIVGRLPKEPIIDDRTYEVKYNGPYSTLGHALFDFRIQTDLPAYKIAHRLYMSTRTVWQLENNKQPTAPKAVMFYRRNEEKIKKRFLSLFAVPKDQEDEFMEIPLFAHGVKSARDDYGTKRPHNRKLRQTSE